MAALDMLADFGKTALPPINGEPILIMPATRLTATQSRAVICLGLALGTLLLYWPLTHYDFTNVDDPRFVTENNHVRAGLTWAGVVWAFHSVYTEAWQPVTWFSHMLDCQLYGLNAGRHHLTSLLIHMANTVLLFLWVYRISKATWRSALVAALFAWHPLHVESVAWICERKDVLCTLFWLLALHAYTGYVRRPGVARFLLVVILYALGLMSKPMVITLPCVLLLLDFWPFNRFGLEWSGFDPQRGAAAATAQDFRVVFKKAGLLLAEKMPFFALGLGMTMATLYAERSGSSLGSLGAYPLSIRVSNALASYLSYLENTFWPVNLAFFYPYSFHIPLSAVLGGALLLLLWIGCFLARIRQQPYLLVGWLWFIGTLVPTIGLVQFCIQARADRYTYLPSMGLFIVLVWGVAELFERWPAQKRWRPVLACAALLGCLGFSSVQIRYWENALTVSRHALEVTEDNYVADESLGRALVAIHRTDLATNFFAEAVRISPGWPQGQFNLGIALSVMHQTNDSLQHLDTAVKLVPGEAIGHERYAETLLNYGRSEEAIREFRTVLQLDPGFPKAQLNLGLALVSVHRDAEAVPCFAEAARQQPNDAEVRFDLGSALLNAHQPDQAAEQFAAELKLTPNETKAHYGLAQALQQSGKFAEAVAQYREALRLTPDYHEAGVGLDQILSAHPELK